MSKKPILFRIDEELKEKLKQLALNNGRSVSNYLQWLIEREVKKNKG
ncbi:MAG: Arc family DNA binding domain-containing protein [Alphaproteobacteria bacterium]|nr:Arc family DNA binding domain-containing protein [Alphaproteobacteria bacterium]